MMNDNDWKLKLRYGKIKTPYKHFTVMASGLAEGVEKDFYCPEGNAMMSMKVWASSQEESADMIQIIGKQIGFTVTGNIEIYNTEPDEPPAENPSGYDIKFFPFDK